MKDALLGSTLEALIACLEDYMTDQRGDVGSWVRAAALRALGEMVAHIAASQGTEKAPALSQRIFDRVLDGMYKLAVEKLELVRGAAAYALSTMRKAGAAAIWQWDGFDCLSADVTEG